MTPVPTTGTPVEKIPGPAGSGEPAKPMPSGTTPNKQVNNVPGALDLTPATTGQETKNPFDSHRQDAAPAQSAADFSWLTGQLMFVHADGGKWILRYASVGKEDPNGGSVVLASGLPMDSYRDGDIVRVAGEILNQQRSSAYLGGPLYRAKSIELIERKSE